MADTIYNYVIQFPDIHSIITRKEDVVEGTNKLNCDSFKTEKINSYNDAEKFTKECAKIAKHQEEIVKNPKFSEAALCKYINYWFYGTLKTANQSSNYDLLGKFYDQVQSLKYCKAYLKKINEDVYNEVKDLYTLYDDFEKFKVASLDTNNPTCDKITECINIYKKYLVKCKDFYKDGLCMNLKYFKYEYDYHKMKTNSCAPKMEELDPVTSDTTAIILLPFVLMTLITFILLFLYKFTSFGSWLRPRLPGGKNKANKLHRRMQELQDSSEPGRRPYKLSYHSS